MSGNARLAGVGACCIGVVLWGVTGTIVKLSTVPGLTLALYRLWLGVAVVMAVAALVGRFPTLRTMRASAAGGLFFGADVLLFFLALKHTSVAHATVIGALQPLLILLVARRWFGETRSVRTVVWTLVTVLGVAGVVFGGRGSAGTTLGGDLLAVGALLAWTGYWLASKHARSHAGLGALEYTVSFLFIAALVATPVVLVSGAPLAVPRPVDWAWLGVLAVFPSAGHLLFAWAHRVVEVTISSVVQASVPVAATGLAVLVLREPITGAQVVGGLAAVAASAALALTTPVEPEATAPS
ncbi:MAG: DMT family transporter [Streptomycetales bacterium]